MTLYFIKGDGPANWGAMKLKLQSGASQAQVIQNMESRDWKSVTASAYNAWKKKWKKKWG